MAQQKRPIHKRPLILILLGATLFAALAWTLLKVTSSGVRTISRQAVALERVVRADETIQLTQQPKNLVVVIADGMGFAHLSAARATIAGIDGISTWDRFQTTGWHVTHPANGFLTDSAASATALSTGSATFNGAVGVDPDEQVLETLLERAHRLGYRTGIVTDSYVWDATPAAFAVHTRNRDLAAEILKQFAHSNLELLFGELEDVGQGGVPTREATIQLLEQRFTLLEAPLEIDLHSDHPVAALFAEESIRDLDSNPNLQEMASTALARLASDSRPFVLLIETEEPDTASHENDLERLLAGMRALDATLSHVLSFAEQNGETLVVFTSDHETGGLALITAPGNQRLRASWASNGHTGTAVPVLAYGPGASHFTGAHTNWQTGQILRAALREPVSQD